MAENKPEPITPEIMPEIFSPPVKRGRRPLVDIQEVLKDLVANKGQWVRYFLPINKSKSLIRQLKDYGDVEIITQKPAPGPDGAGMRVVYVRVTEQ